MAVQLQHDIENIAIEFRDEREKELLHEKSDEWEEPKNNTQVEWEEPISKREREELYRCFNKALQKEEEKLLTAIDKQIHDTLEKTGKLPTIDEYKDLDKLIAIREEHTKYLIRMSIYPDRISKIYDTSAGEIDILIKEFCRSHLYVLMEAKIEKLTNSIQNDLNNNQKILVKKSDELNALCEVVKMWEKVEAELDFTERENYGSLSGYTLHDCRKTIYVGRRGN